MKRLLNSVSLALVLTGGAAIAVQAEQPLGVVYPPNNHETTAKQIFLIGTAPPKGQVFVNGKPIARSGQGHFAPSFPLQIGDNLFTLRYQNQEVKLKVTRTSANSPVPQSATFLKDSLTPAIDIARLPGELMCFSAIAPPNAQVSVKLGNQTIPLQATAIANLPANSGVLTGMTQPTQSQTGQYSGCATATAPGQLGQPQYVLNFKGQTVTQAAPGKVSILTPAQLEIAEVTVDQGAARTGASTDFSRMTPLPKGTRATITGREGDWVRLDYGGWIRAKEVQVVQSSVPPRSLIRGITSRTKDDWTEILFPLQTPVPVSVQQENGAFLLSLHNTTAQTDTIRLVNNPVLSRLDWQQTTPGRVDYRITLRNQQQWGYKLRYEGTTLVLSLKNPPKKPSSSLQGIKILLDPGHGGPEDLGARGPNGFPEKTVALSISERLRQELVKRGAAVVMTRQSDVDVDLATRVAAINREEPTIALSIHYNALPDEGDAIATQGIATFWYQGHSHGLAEFLHNYLVKRLNRSSYGVYWNNLALTRPAVAPSVMLELGFMINPTEFEWITNPQEQQKLVTVLADGVTEWFQQTR
jgi:N-acetylmuramoyl-L-alanine amidase